MALNALIFDMDGTLLDTNRAHVAAWSEGFRKHGFQIPDDRIGPQIGKGGDMLLPALIGARAEEEKGDAIRESVKEAFQRIAKREPFRLFDGAEALAKTLRDREFALALATSAGEEDLEAIMKSAGVDIRDWFDAVVSKSDVASSKPEPDVVLSAAEKLGLSPAQCAMVGDTPFDAISARRAGVVTLGVLSGNVVDPDEMRQKLIGSGVRGIWRDVAHLLGELDDALRRASPTRVSLTRQLQEELMHEALAAAREGMENGEAPIGCAIADTDGQVVARAYNEMQRTGNKTAHAEIVAFSKAAGRMPVEARDFLLVSTLEPCVMCTGAAMVGAVDTIIFGLPAPADNGSGRVTPPQSPESQMPRIAGKVLAAESRALFEEWMERHGDTPQSEYIRQLLESTQPDGAVVAGA